MSSLSAAELDALVAEAVVDCYDEHEQLSGLFVMIQDNLVTPFDTEVLGAPVVVREVVCVRRGSWPSAIVAGCSSRSGSGSAVAGSRAGGCAVDRGVSVVGGRLMSEYQYYEFVALDQALTAKQQGELRAVSSRGRITSSGFVNDYQWVI